MTTRLFSRTDVEERIDLDRLLAAVERTYAETARGRVLNPPKLAMHMGDDGEWPGLNAFSIDMPAYVDWLGVAGTKWAAATWDADGEPISSLVVLFDPERGRIEAVMEGMYLTGVRTALQTVVGVRHLPSARPRSVGVFGAGFQAEFQLAVVDDLLDVDLFRVYDVDPAVARALAAEVGPRIGAGIEVCDGPREAADSDAVVTVTDSKTPVLEDGWLDGSEFVVALGSYRELPDATILGADHLVVDHVEQCLQRGALADLAGRGELSPSDLDATIGEVLADDRQGLVGEDERGIFVPIGLGGLDIAIAECVSRTEGEWVREFDFVGR